MAGDAMVLQLRERLRELEGELAAAKARADVNDESARRERAWLGHISWRCVGMGADLARQALYSDQWPPKEPGR